MSAKREASGSRSPELKHFLDDLAGRVHVPADATPLPAEDLNALREIEGDVDLFCCFAAAGEEAGLVVRKVTEATWGDEVVELLRRHSATKVLVQPTEESAFYKSRADALRGELIAADVAVHTSVDDETVFGVDAAITGVAAAIAETGTLVCTSGPGLARGASLIPPIHIALVDAGQIVPDLFDFFPQLTASAPLPANVNLISGPSKTADIEGILITGVHGPGHVYVLVFA